MAGLYVKCSTGLKWVNAFKSFFVFSSDTQNIFEFSWDFRCMVFFLKSHEQVQAIPGDWSTLY